MCERADQEVLYQYTTTQTESLLYNIGTRIVIPTQYVNQQATRYRVIDQLQF
jgi:hypothetical protein